MAAWTKPASPAGKGEQVFIVAVRAANTGKTLFQVTTFKIGPDKIGDDWAVKSNYFLKCKIGDHGRTTGYQGGKI